MQLDIENVAKTPRKKLAVNMLMVYQSNNTQNTNFNQTKSFSNKTNVQIKITATKQRAPTLLQQLSTPYKRSNILNQDSMYQDHKTFFSLSNIRF